jgi:hypothetical protein
VGFSLLIQLYPDDDLRAWRCAYVNLHVADILGGEDAMPDIPIPDRIRKALQRLPVCGSGKVMQIILKMK